jgi:tetratricopeptide (TPR) repeat protein
MHDADLFKQPDISHWGECSICCLPLSLDTSKSILMSCCCKIICNGCNYANKKREFEGGLEHRCPYCRNPRPKSQEEFDKQFMIRIKKNDPVAMAQMGKKHDKERDYVKALEYYTKAAELGDVDAHCGLGGLYYQGDGVDKDEKRAVYHFEQAAIGGHPSARGYLAEHEKNKGRLDRAAKHWVIAANLGCDLSLKRLKNHFVLGIVSKEDYAAALRGHQAAVDATKSAEREKAEEAAKKRYGKH